MSTSNPSGNSGTPSPRLQTGRDSPGRAAAAIHRKDHVIMGKRENDANKAFRPSDRPLTEYEKEQIALRKNLERLKAERSKDA
jgi:hypothetical protein